VTTSDWRNRPDDAAEAAVSAWMQELAGLPVAAPPLPDPGFVWMKAQLLRRLEGDRQAAAAAEVGDRVQVGLAAAAALVLLAWLLSERAQVLTARPLAALLVVLMVAAGAVMTVVGWSARDRLSLKP
jgi:hypothetical protein